MPALAGVLVLAIRDWFESHSSHLQTYGMKLQLLHEAEDWRGFKGRSEIDKIIAVIVSRMHPDELFNYADKRSAANGVTFMYKDGELRTDLVNAKHYEMNAEATSRQDLIKQGYILGRILNGIDLNHPYFARLNQSDEIIPRRDSRIDVISFWNETGTPEFRDCLKQIVDNKLVGGNVWIVGSGQGAVKLDELMGTGGKVKEPQPQSLWSPELLRKLHTMTPASKKVFMAMLGNNPQAPKTSVRQFQQQYTSESRSGR